MDKIGGQSPVESMTEVSQIDFDHDLFKELGFDLESREEVLGELEVMFGGRVFRYGEYSGTVRDMANSCPAFGDILEQGVPTAAAWLEANDQPRAENTEDEEKLDNPDEPPEVEKASVAEKVSGAANKLNDDTGLTQKAASKGPAHIVKSEIKEESKALETVAAEEVQNIDSGKSKSEHSIKDSSSTTIKAPVPIATTLTRSTGQDEPTYSYLKVPLEKPASIPANTTPQIDMIHEAAAKEYSGMVHDGGVIDTRKSTEAIFEEAELDSGYDQLYPAIESIEKQEEPVTDKSDILIPEFNLGDTDEDTATIEKDQDSTTDDRSDTETLLGVMMNEIVKPIDVVDNEFQESTHDTQEYEGLKAETLELLSELIPEAPKALLEASETLIVELNRQASTTIEVIQILQKSKTAEECREALTYLRLELENLLVLLGYESAQRLAEQLVKQHGALTLKKYIVLLMKSLAQSPEHPSGKLGQISSPTSPRRYGAHAVRAVVNLTFKTPQLQAA